MSLPVWSHVPSGGYGPPLVRTSSGSHPPKWVVRILLECTLVIKSFGDKIIGNLPNEYEMVIIVAIYVSKMFTIGDRRPIK